MTEKFENVSQRLVPSKETIRRFEITDEKINNFNKNMGELSTNFLLMKKDIESICTRLDQNTIEHKNIMDKIDKFIETADVRYAEKRVELIVGKILWAVGFLVIGAMAAAFFNIILK